MGIISCIDQDQCVILMFLDLCTAFDIVDCDILVGRLSSRLGIKGVVSIMDAISVLAELSF